MITIFTTPKPFSGQNKINQINAISSWKALHPDIEVIIFGNGEGVKDIAENMGLRHIVDVKNNEYSTPLISSMFELAEKAGRFDMQMYINCDIILMDDFIPSVKCITMNPFLMVSQRWDLTLNEAIDFKNPDWQKILRKKVEENGILHLPTGIDYFLYNKGIWKNIPDMVVGRAGYDNWLIYYCRSRNIPVIDSTGVITAVHQNHDYKHIKNEKEEAFSGPEASKNIELGGGHKFLFTIADADWKIDKSGLSKIRINRENWYRFFDVFVFIRQSLLLFIIWRCFKFFYNGFIKLKRNFHFNGFKSK
ncbi:hypothetical protein HY745_09820 [Candidatus Desantisbacteria bacterium]|nr:hypothetical protein [Candidatus Desantisbacteria bacterium]